MTKLWEALKGRAEWVYLVLFLALGVWGLTRSAWVEAGVDFGVGVVMFFVLRWLKASAPVSVSLAVDLAKRGGSKPIPFEGSPEWLAEHRAEMPNCTLCKQWGWDKL